MIITLHPCTLCTNQRTYNLSVCIGAINYLLHEENTQPESEKLLALSMKIKESGPAITSIKSYDRRERGCMLYPTQFIPSNMQ